MFQTSIFCVKKPWIFQDLFFDIFWWVYFVESDFSLFPQDSIHFLLPANDFAPSPGPCVHPQFTTKTSFGIPRTPKPRVQFLLFLFRFPPPSTPATQKKSTNKPSEKSSRFGRGKRWKITTFINEKNLTGAVRHAECSSLGLSSLGLWSKTVNTNGLRGSQGFGWWCGDGGCSIETHLVTNYIKPFHKPPLLTVFVNFCLFVLESKWHFQCVDPESRITYDQLLVVACFHSSSFQWSYGILMCSPVLSEDWC